MRPLGNLQPEVGGGPRNLSTAGKGIEAPGTREPRGSRANEGRPGSAARGGCAALVTEVFPSAPCGRGAPAPASLYHLPPAARHQPRPCPPQRQLTRRTSQIRPI